MPLPILLISAGIFHPSLPARAALRQTIENSGEFSLQAVPSPEALPALNPKQYRAVVLYYHLKSISPQALDALESYLHAGGGCLAVHSASASFKKERRYFELLGGQFSSHGPVESFQVFPASASDPIFESASPFTVRDERYLHAYDPQNKVHFYSQAGGSKEPFVWTRRPGLGRVCYCAAGHTASSMQHASIRQILLQGLRWAAGVAERGENP